MHSHHQRTLEAVFAHPLKHGLRASQVEALCRALGAEVEAISDRRLQIRMPSGAETWIRIGDGLRHPHLDATSLLRLRHLFTSAGVSPSHPLADEPHPRGDRSLRLVLHLSQHATEVFRLEAGPNGDSVEHSVLRPHGLWGSGENLTHRHDRDIAGQRAPLDNDYLARLTAAIASADAVLLMGHGHGASDLRRVLLHHLTVHRPDLLNRIVGVVTVDGHSLQTDGLLALAREHFGTPPSRHLPMVPLVEPPPQGHC